MSMRLIKEEYDSNNGITKLTFKTKGGDIIVGEAKLNPEDKEYESKITGGFIAEAKAMKKYAKIKIKKINYQIEILEELNNRLSDMKGHDSQNLESKQIRKHLFILKNERNLLKNFVNDNKSFIDKYVNDKIGWFKSIRAKKGRVN